MLFHCLSKFSLTVGKVVANEKMRLIMKDCRKSFYLFIWKWAKKFIWCCQLDPSSATPMQEGLCWNIDLICLYSISVSAFEFFSWPSKQHPTQKQLYSLLSSIMKTIQVRWTKYAGHCWRVSKVGDRSRGWPEGSLFDCYYTKV